MNKRTITPLCAMMSMAALLPISRANAQLSLTAVGTAAGFSLSTFASGFPSVGTAGPLGITFTSTGGVLVSDELGNLRLFTTDVDGQAARNAASITNYGTENALGLASTGGKYFMAENVAGKIVRVNGDTTFNSTLISGLNIPLDLVTSPTTGHLLASIAGSNKIIDVDPNSGLATDVITGLPSVDGISISADGTIVYVAVTGNSHLQGYNIASKALVFDTTVAFLDGTQVGTGTLAGNIFVNTHDGKLIEIRLSDGFQTVIANGGSRGDFVVADPNGTLLITQSSIVQRLSAPVGGGFGNTTPEPGSLTLLASLGLTAATFLRRRKAR